MGNNLYTAFRTNGFPTFYGENKQPVTADVLIAGLIFAFAIILLSFLAIVPGFRGKERLPVVLRFVCSLLIGSAILVCNFGQEWEISKAETKTHYKAFSKHEFKVKIGVKIGLRSVNITLEGNPIYQKGERIQYNERFSWEWAQGRNGFGPQAGRINREFRAAQWKGLPYPILWIAEYFTLDGEGIRFGRHYRTAGWYCHIMMWVAFPLWILSNILFFMVIRYGAYFLFLTGICLLTSNIIFVSIRNSIPLVIPIGTVMMEFHYGWSFWITLITGLNCVIVGAVILLFDLRNPDFISTFFGLDVLQDYEDFYASPEQFREKPIATSVNDLEKETPESELEEMYGMRKRTFSVKFQRGSYRRPTPTPRHIITDELPVYENFAVGSFDTIEEDNEGDGSHDNIALNRM